MLKISEGDDFQPGMCDN